MSAGANVGFQFVTMEDGTWYLFHREYAFEPQPSYCKADYARIVVLKSTDQGKTWLDKTVIVTPVPNTPTGRLQYRYCSDFAVQGTCCYHGHPVLSRVCECGRRGVLGR